MSEGGQFKVTFETFLDTVKEAVDSEFSDGTTLKYKKITKNNGVEVTGAFLERPDAPGRYQLLYMEQVFGALGEEPDPAAAVRLILDCLDTEVPKEVGSLSMASWDEVKDRVILRLVGREKNRERLESLVYEEVLDMAAVACILFDGRTVGRGITEISRGMLESWKTDRETVLSAARDNTPRLLPETLKTLREAAMIQAEEDGMDSLYVLSNTSTFCGAAAILYSGKMRGLAEKYGKDILILPTSIHETILVPEGSFDVGFLRKALESVNAADVPKEDVLTDSVYRYRRSDGEITIV